MKLKLSQIIIKAGTRHRADKPLILSYEDEDEDVESVSKQYAELMREGVVFPPLIVFKDCDHGYYYLVDGFLRLEAYLYNWEPLPKREPSLPEEMEVECEVIEGTLRQAQEFSFGVDAKSSKPLTKKDKRFVVTQMLSYPEWNKWSDGKIAEFLGCSQPFVRGIRDELTYNGYKFPEKRLGRDGKERGARRHNKQSSEDNLVNMTPWLAEKYAERAANQDIKEKEFMDLFIDYTTDNCEIDEAVRRMDKTIAYMKDARFRLVMIHYWDIQDKLRFDPEEDT